jgi:phosphatidylserine/phosphatidylglycerophosphate/cardiolipin synthase-like enzyme
MQGLSQNAEIGEKPEVGEDGKGFRLPLTFFGEDTTENKASKSFNNNEYKVLTTPGISSKIIDIINDSKEYCLIITPYLKEWLHLQKYLITARDNKKRIVFFFREDQNGEKKINDFYDNYKFDIVFIKDLHAKIYINENEALLTSMNLYDTSQEKNYEIGVLIKNQKIIDEHIKTYIFDQIFKTGKIDELTKKSDNNFYKLLENNLFFEKIDYCVYCGEPKKYVANNRYYCNECHEERKKQNDFTKKNFRFCATCGKNDTEEHSQCSECNEKKPRK